MNKIISFWGKHRAIPASKQRQITCYYNTHKISKGSLQLLNKVFLLSFFFVFFFLEIPSNPLCLCLHSWLPNQFSHSQQWSQRILLLANWNLSIMLWCPSSNKKQQPGNTYTVSQIIGNKHVQLNNSARKHQRLWKQSTDIAIFNSIHCTM